MMRSDDLDKYILDPDFKHPEIDLATLMSGSICSITFQFSRGTAVVFASADPFEIIEYYRNGMIEDFVREANIALQTVKVSGWHIRIWFNKGNKEEGLMQITGDEILISVKE
jgi:hypothetical protein